MKNIKKHKEQIPKIENKPKSVTPASTVLELINLNTTLINSIGTDMLHLRDDINTHLEIEKKIMFKFAEIFENLKKDEKR